MPKPGAMTCFIGKIKNISPSLKRLRQNAFPMKNRGAAMQELMAGEEVQPAALGEGRLGRNMRVRYQGGKVHFEEVPGGILGPTPLSARFRNAYNALRDRLRRKPYQPGFKSTFTTRVRDFVAAHRRKLAITGGVLAGGAIIGGLAGGLSKKEEKMREGNVGALANIIKGGGGVGSFGGGGGGGGGGSGGAQG